MSQPLYDRLGGPAAVTAVVDRFYERVVADPLLLPVFEKAGTDFVKLKDHQRKFISSALGGPQQYSGQSMAKAHEAYGITGKQFDAVVVHLADTLKEAGVGEEDIQTVAALLGPLKGEIVTA